MEIIQYATHGRTLLVEFKCYRCKKTTSRPLEDCINENKENYNKNLYDLRPPKEWKDGGFYYPLFCPECAKAYELFMKGGGSDA